MIANIQQNLVQQHWNSDNSERKHDASTYVCTKAKPVYLKKVEVSSTVLRGDLTEANRQLNYANWKTVYAPVMLATKAFGAGIGYSTLRLVVHITMATSLSSYVQDSGRLSRDGTRD